MNKYKYTKELKMKAKSMKKQGYSNKSICALLGFESESNLRYQIDEVEYKKHLHSSKEWRKRNPEKSKQMGKKAVKKYRIKNCSRLKIEFKERYRIDPQFRERILGYNKMWSQKKKQKLETKISYKIHHIWNKFIKSINTNK